MKNWQLTLIVVWLMVINSTIWTVTGHTLLGLVLFALAFFQTITAIVLCRQDNNSNNGGAA